MPPLIRVALYVFAVVFVALLAMSRVEIPRAVLPPTSSPLLRLSIKERGEVFRTEILEAGLPCDRVTLMERSGVGHPFRRSSRDEWWWVDCQNGHQDGHQGGHQGGQSYSILVDPFDPSGSTMVGVP